MEWHTRLDGSFSSSADGGTWDIRNLEYCGRDCFYIWKRDDTGMRNPVMTASGKRTLYRCTMDAAKRYCEENS